MQPPLRLPGIAGRLQTFKQCDTAWLAVDVGLVNTGRSFGCAKPRPVRVTCSILVLCIIVARYFFISIMNTAMSSASLRVSRRFGIVAWGRSRNEAIMSELMGSLAAIAANEGTPRNLPDVDLIAWHSEHHRSDNRRPFSVSCATVAWVAPKKISATERCNFRMCMAVVS